MASLFTRLDQQLQAPFLTALANSGFSEVNSATDAECRQHRERLDSWSNEAGEAAGEDADGLLQAFRSAALKLWRLSFNEGMRPVLIECDVVPTILKLVEKRLGGEDTWRLLELLGHVCSSADGRSKVLDGGGVPILYNLLDESTGMGVAAGMGGAAIATETRSKPGTTEETSMGSRTMWVISTLSEPIGEAKASAAPNPELLDKLGGVKKIAELLEHLPHDAQPYAAALVRDFGLQHSEFLRVGVVRSMT